MSFKLEVWKFWKFPVPFGISTRFEWTPAVPLVVKSYKMAASLSSRHHTGCKMIVRTCSWSKAKTSDFLENCGLVVTNSLWVSSPGLHTLPREKFVSFSQIKYQGRVEFWMRLKIFHMKQLNRALKTATSSLSFSIFSCNSWWEMCSSGNRTRSVRPGGKYPYIRHTEISEIQTGIFGRMERAHELHKSWRKCWKSQVSFCHQSSPMSRKAWTLPWISQEFKNTLEKGAFGHSMRVLNERSVSDGGNLCPLWLEILKSLGYSVGDTS